MAGCDLIRTEDVKAYSRANLSYLYSQKKWLFEGRMVLISQQDSWSAQMIWNHDADLEKVKLVGPLGQGGLVISLAKGKVRIDKGSGNVFESNEPAELVARETGIIIPIESLRYWVLGLPDPLQSFHDTDGGFVQLGWLCEFKQIITSNLGLVPKKILISNDKVRMKLIVDKWDMS